MRLQVLTGALIALSLAAPALAQEAHQGHQHGAPAQADPHAGHSDHAAQPPQADPHADHDMSAQPETADHAMHAMTGLFGAYPMGRDGSGTSWQADVSEHGGVHAQRGGWMLMGHALLNAVYDYQGGPRGDEMGFLAGMVMGSARRDFAHGTLTFRAMLSPDPLMGEEGYPLLLAAGETADGVNTLIDRQHPHDLFMELSASYSHRLSDADSVFLYAGLPGEPAYGPPAFMHRLSAMDSPEAPITHHWMDSTHITFGVLTAGYVHRNWKLEVSSFRGREPDEERYDIEEPRLDSTAVRVSWNPNENWSLQASWADVESPEQLEPDEDETRWSASAIYTRRVGEGWFSATAAFARKDRSDDITLDAWFLEAALRPNDDWTFFARYEAIETDELEGHHGDIEDVSRLSAGAIRDWRVHDHVAIGLGALVSRNFVSDALDAAYDGDQTGAMAFVRLRVD
ncbi:MAG: hypothetical protein AB7J28_01915 [Hyphomonadaceae bacterium]